MRSSKFWFALFMVAFFRQVLVAGESPQFGRGSFPVDGKILKCKNFTFPSPFTNDNVHVHITIQNESPKSNVYEAAVGWVEDVGVAGFTGCVVASGPDLSSRQLSADWMAFQDTPPGSQTGRLQVPLFTTGSKCVETSFGMTFNGSPVVHITAVHKTRHNKHDATSVWVEDITSNKFKACFREIKNFDGIHKNIFVDWIAMSTIPSAWSKAPESKALIMPNTGSPPAKFNYGFCQNVTFTDRFYERPCVITTAAHQYEPLKSQSIPPSKNAITEWTKDVTVTGFSVCVKDIQALEAIHAPVTIQFIALGHLHPCVDIKCPYYATCKAKSASEHECICDFSCPSFEDYLCSAQGVTYSNQCEYKKAICLSKKHVGISHPGSCKPFIVQRRFAALDMSSDEMKCSDIVYNASDFYALQPIHVLLTINHGGQTNGLVHDAVNTWVENVGEGKFTACAMKSGRLEHDIPLPPDYGLASVDWVAFQGSPRGGLVGIELIEDWWEGTTCNLVTLPTNRFSEIPSVLLTAKHAALKRKRDAATLWTEDITKTSFKICIRELQNFDGHHQNISVSWMAYEYLPRNTFAEFDSVYFPNGVSPKDSNNHAFCQNVTFKVNYMKRPAVMISATHNSTSGLLPDFNSITSWIENIDKNGFTVCMKEVHFKSVYDPVSITWVTMPECNSPLGVGMYNRRTPANKMSASSQISDMYKASLGWLNNRAWPGVHAGTWCALNNTGQWLQIDLGYLHVVTGVATQGRNSTLEQMWVKTYQLSFSKNGKTWEVYKENNITQVLNGNKESNIVVQNALKESLQTRYVRFLPITWHDHVCMRVEVYGCEAYTEPIHVNMMSAGCDDPPSDRCGDSSIMIDGIEVSPKQRGHNVVALDQEGSVIDAKGFDTWAESSSGKNMAAFITSLPDHTVVLISVMESGNSFVDDAADALKSLGATEPLNPGYRGSWLLVGYKGTGEKPSWIRQASNPRYFGPTYLAVRVFE